MPIEGRNDKMRIIYLCLVLFVVYGCNSYVHISEIREDPQKYQDKQVTVRGKVIETFALPFLHKGMYQIDDDTGKIWILSQDTVPFRGEEVTVNGTIKSAITINDQTFGTVLVEKGK